jgi:hypothetical protein
MKTGNDMTLCVGGVDSEVWKPIVGGEGIYEVSSTGKAKSRYVPGGRGRLGPWRLLKPRLDQRGYLFVTLYSHGKQTHHQLHHLVADAILAPKSTTDTVVRHLNDNRLDNRVENLARGTSSDNAVDAFRNSKRKSPVGIAHGMAKLTEDDVRETRRLYATGEFSYRKLARRFGVAQSEIGNIVRLETWKHIA